jgi:hypothetical protein
MVFFGYFCQQYITDLEETRKEVWYMFFFIFQNKTILILKEEFEDAKRVIRIRISKKNRQHSGLLKWTRYLITNVC